MNQKNQRLLEGCGINVDAALDRFMNNEAMYLKFLFKFLNDKNLDILRESISNEDVDGAFDAAHTLKGVAANLELGDILIYLTPMVELLRDNKFDGVQELFVKMSERYQTIHQAIQKLVI